MKKILFIVAVSGSLLAACNPAGFTVNGTTEGVTEGKVLLVARSDNNTYDTLATAPIVNGAFTLTGKVEDVTLTTLSIEGTRVRIAPLFIENETFTVKLGKTSVFEGNKLTVLGTPSTVEGGGPVQQVYSLYFSLQQEGAVEDNKLQAAFFATEDAAARDSIRKLAQEVRKATEAKTAEVIKANPDAYATAYQVYSKSSQATLEQLNEQFALLGENAKTTKYGKLIAERIQLLTAVAIGQVAPDFKLATPEGDTISLHGIVAKVKLIDFWASWCGPCRGENPNVVKVYAEYQPKGLEIIGVSLDDNREKWLQAIADDKLTWKHGSDLKGWSAAPAKLYGVNAIPHTVLLDENNKIIAKNLRGDALKQKIAELLD
jgi:thiol-disulfide isomerase/thioredoxin/predicted small secreted protein